MKSATHSSNSLSQKDIRVVPSAPMVIKDDPTLMFTTATIVALVASLVTDLPVDSLIGAAVSVVVLFLVSLRKITIDPLLGIKPDPETIKK